MVLIMDKKDKLPNAPLFETQAISNNTNKKTGEASTSDENVLRAKKWVDENEK
jgi:hypothetical protein